MNNQKSLLSGYILAAVTIFFWGITFVCTKTLLKDFSALEILFYRFLAAYISLWCMRPKFIKIDKKDNIIFALSGLSGVVVYQFAENISTIFTTASNVSVIVSICPLFTAITAQIFLKEKHVTSWFIAGFIISLLGVVLVSFNGNATLHISPKGDLLALCSAISWGFYSLLISIINKKNYDPICATRRIFFFAVMLMIPLVLAGYAVNTTGITGDLAKSMAVTFDSSVNIARFSKPMNILFLLFLGVVASGFCFSAWNKACRIVGTVKISCELYLIPVVTIICAYFALGEKITVMGAAGALVTIAGLFISGKTSNKTN